MSVRLPRARRLDVVTDPSASACGLLESATTFGGAGVVVGAICAGAFLSFVMRFFANQKPPTSADIVEGFYVVSASVKARQPANPVTLPPPVLVLLGGQIFGLHSVDRRSKPQPRVHPASVLLIA